MKPKKAQVEDMISIRENDTMMKHFTETNIFHPRRP